VGAVGNDTAVHGAAPLYFEVNGRPLFAKGHNWMPVPPA
jgi:beta-galactosidase/beta-glucuronidase